ncbi:hypothetical protein HCCG_01539 [Helicobacter cinaedi CCUG 18818 = ATCC BAA-847]|uniref:Uncharacterized protein n=1 Tax=Helicobacter cinaedi CCUG 18818 = ATCC BAA-847 TaxID=537971 RepID=A0ABN0BBP6_9HELI|nr:hypothetical protein HCCG_01539 [Helicobacter cinaedi CCUG 18818 = ATCC BAA-847]
MKQKKCHPLARAATKSDCLVELLYKNRILEHYTKDNRHTLIVVFKVFGPHRICVD